MDDEVLRALRRWPSVPAMFGWLRLDRRGNWRLVDRGLPGFDETRDASGSTITNQRIVAFIARNYACDERGRWFWQNGPQRVYVDLDAAPLVLRAIGGVDRSAEVDADATPDANANANASTAGTVRFVAHTGTEVSRIDSAWTGPEGQLLLGTDLGGAIVHDLDLAALPLEWCAGSLTLRWNERALTIEHTDTPERVLGFVSRPRDEDGSLRAASAPSGS